MWETQDDKLQKTFIFRDFTEAMTFLLKVSYIAEKQNHHPEIYNVYNKVTLALCTHDAGNSITDKDHQLAKAIDQLVA